MNTNQKIASTMLVTRLRQLLVAVLSVTFGISMYIFMNSFMAGVNNEQTEITFTSMSHIKVYNDLPFDVKPILPNPEDGGTVLMVNNARNLAYTEGIKNADAIKARMLADKFDIFVGPLKDNKGKEVIPAGKVYKQTDLALEGMNYLVEGVIGSI